MLSFEECNELSKSGEPCQMLTPDGKWVKFDESQVITKFRRARDYLEIAGFRIPDSIIAIYTDFATVAHGDFII